MEPDPDEFALVEQALGGPLAGVAEQVRAVMLPSIRLVRGEERGAVGRIGGSPALPAGTAWPRWQGHALAFMAEIDLAALPRVDGTFLPASGYLSFFYAADYELQPWGFDAEHRGGGQVVFTDAAAERVELAPPADASGENRYAPGHLQARPEITLPERYAPAMPALPASAHGPYDDLFEALTSHRDGYGMTPQHRLLGHPDQVQGEMQSDIDQIAGPGDWRLLLQLDSEFEGQEVLWGDSGRIYFWVDAGAGDFAATWTVLQCS